MPISPFMASSRFSIARIIILQSSMSDMRHVLVAAGKRYGMMFVGYSGRDASIMEALNEVLDGPAPFPNGLYWLASSAARLLPAVTAFLTRAQGLPSLCTRST